MDKQKERENYAYFDQCRLEAKLELVAGRLLVGNSLAGSRLLLDHILRGYTVEAAVALGSVEQWVEALCAAHQLPPPATLDDASLSALHEKALRLNVTIPDFSDGAAGADAGHWRVRSHLQYSFWDVHEALGGHVLGRDFVMRLDENGFTPDVLFFKNKKLNKFYDSHLEGPAELVIEVTRPAHRDYDIHVKREHYARAGVPEYLIVDPEQRECEFLRLVRGDYVRQTPDADGLYRPASAPGLALAPQHFWPEKDNFSLRGEHNPFLVEMPQAPARRERDIPDGLGWGKLPFAPRLALQPVAIHFEEYLCWVPEAKFEFWDGQIQISGDEGVRNVLGLLLMTLGLAEACRCAPPAEWLAALQSRRANEAREPRIRAEWRRRLLRAAAELREQFQIERIALTGALLSPQPLTYWSHPTLAVWAPREDSHRIYQHLAKDEIDFVEGDWKYFQDRVRNGEYLLEEI